MWARRAASATARSRPSRAGAVPVLIGDHVLRTSTAGVVALAQLQALAPR